MKLLKKMSLIFVGIVLISIFFIGYFLFRRETSEWTENITISPNTEISVDLMSSQRGYFGGHGLGWGGGGSKGAIKFMHNGVHYESKTPYTPIAIKYDAQVFYMICFDRETDFNKITFRFYKATVKGEFKEIKASEFPKHLAIQNRWFDTDEKRDKTEQLQLDKMQGSLTAKIWYQLEKEINYHEMPSYIPLEFLQDYKENYIQ